MLENQRNILKDTTNQLLVGLQDIFNANRNSTIPAKTIINPQSLYFPPISSLSSYIEPQTLQPRTMPKVLVNLKRPFPATTIDKQHKIAKFQKLDPKLSSSEINSDNKDSTNTNNKNLQKN